MGHSRSEKHAEREALVLKALDGIANGKWSSATQAASALGISKDTVSRRLSGGKSVAESRENSQLLTIPEEKALVEWITRLTMTGHPATHAFIREMAEEIRRKRVEKINNEMELISYDPIGTKWVPTFLKRYPQLETTLSEIIEAA